MAEAANVLFADFWTWRLSQSPEFATMVGSKEHNSRLETFTEKRFSEDVINCLEFQKRAEVLLESSKLTPEVKDNVVFFLSEVETFIEGCKHPGYFFPINYMEGVHVDFQRLSEWGSLDSTSDYENLVSRYLAFPTHVKEIITIMRTGIAKGMINHSCSMEGVVEMFRGHLQGDVKETVFYKPFLDLEKEEKLKAEARKAVEEGVRKGMAEMADFLEKEYIPKCRPEIAASSLPGGNEFYLACLRFHTSTSMTPLEIHNKGLEEVARIEGEMKEVIKEMGLDLTLPEFIKKLREDKDSFFSSPKELLDTFSTIIFTKVAPQLSKLFLKSPKSKLEITETPLASYPAAFYIAGTPDGSRTSKVFVNTHKFASQPKYELVSLALHEANPGHHLQGDYIQQNDWPSFRKVMEDRAYSQAPSRFPINTAYVEGWGLYSETLGHDLGLYSDPMDKYGHLSEEIFRACRLVVDPGMHALNWTRDMAVQFMLDHSSASKENIVGEVNRYVTWPGQATGYKIGQLKLLELRKKSEQVLEEKFDIKAFHEVVLKAAGPLDILEKKVLEWIQMEEKKN